uniref:Ig-like domain-containing protein n=1 Tax=Sinocyclocheilus rhinocerous TaxID=307959 RepID=A0A673GL61_9TELE
HWLMRIWSCVECCESQWLKVLLWAAVNPSVNRLSYLFTSPVTSLGETVTLTCDIQRAGNIQWTYSWFKDGNTLYPYRTTTTAEYSFSAYYVSDSGDYSCRGQRSDITHTSVIKRASHDSVWVNEGLL